MRKKTPAVLKCVNYEEHLTENDKHPNLQTAPLFVRNDMVHYEGWEKFGDGWLCSDCVKRAGNWGLRGDMV